MNGDRTSVRAGASGAALKQAGVTRRARRLTVKAPWPSVALKWRLAAVATLGAGAAAGVAYATAQNPDAAPLHAAVILRVLIIAMLIATGLYAASSPSQARMGTVLLTIGFYASIWLLNGARGSVLFTVGIVSSGLAPPVFAYLMLAHPRGRLASGGERRLVLIAGGALAAGWTLTLLTARQPSLRTPLLQCVPRCPHNALYVGSGLSSLKPVLKAVISISWTAVACVTPVILLRRVRAARAPLRRALVPVAVAALANGLLWLSFFAARAAHSDLTGTLGAAYVAIVVVIPGAILTGLVLERLFMGRALAGLTTELMQRPQSDPAVLMAGALDDPSLEIAYQRLGVSTPVDFSGAEVALREDAPDRAVTWIERDRRRIAAVSYDAKLADQAGFVQAAGAAAMMRLDGAQLEAELKASARELAASRIRLVEAADAERQRIERDIHDGVQQQLVGLRVKLDIAAEAIREETAGGQQMLTSIGHQMDEMIDGLRSLARGIYPSLLTERGLVAAVRSAAQRSPIPISLRTDAVGRYADDIEVAVYFCCLEAIQNIVKHAQRSAQGAVGFWQDGGWLCFEVVDSGKGFDARAVKPGSGLVNMRDRVEAVGGNLTITSRQGHGTSVKGQVPIAPPGGTPIVA